MDFWECSSDRAGLSFGQVFCMADINRATSQLIRGGGAACFTNNMDLWTLFGSIINIEEECQANCPTENILEDDTDDDIINDDNDDNSVINGATVSKA